MANQSIAISLEVDDKGSVVVKKFSKGTVDKVKQMSDKSIGYVKRLSDKFTKGLGGAISGIGRALTSLKALAIGALAGWGVTKVLGEFATFESALVDMGKVTTESYDSIKNKIMELPPALGSATELTQGYYQVISAGVEGAANQLDTLTTASKLAKTAHADQAQVIVGLSSVMDAFKVESMEAADALQTMEKTGKTTVAGLIPVIGELSSSSAALGIDMDAMGAAFAAVTLQSGGTEKAATQYKALLTSLLAPTQGMIDLLGKYGGAQNAIKEIGFGGVLKLIKDETGGNAEATKKLVGSVEAYLGFLSASANDMQTYNANLEEQKNKTGAVEKAWKDYKETLNAIWDTFKNTIGKQVIEIGEKLAPAIKAVIETTGEWLDKNREFITVTFEGWINGALGGIANLIESIAGTVEGLYNLKKIVHETISFMAAMGSVLVDVAAGFALLDPINAYKAAVDGMRDTFPILAELKDKFDDVGVSQAKSAIEAKNSQEKFAGYAKTLNGVADSVRGLITTEEKAQETSQTLSAMHDEMVKKMESGTRSANANMKADAQTTANNMVTVWKDKIVEIDGVYTSIKEKVEVPATISVNDQATVSLQTIQNQAETTHDLMSKSITISAIDHASPVLKNIQAEIAKIKDKTVTITVQKFETVTTKFEGEGSSVAPLSEKATEMTEAVQNYSNAVNSMNTNVNTLFMGTGAQDEELFVSDAIYQVEAGWSACAKNIESTVPKAQVDFSQAIGGVEVMIGMLEKISKLKAIFETAAYFGVQVVGRAALWEQIRAMEALYTTLFKKMTVGSYASGTDYVPHTGLYELHQGEMVIDPQQSAQIRNQGGESYSKSTSNNTTIGDVHIHIPSNAAPQSAQDWRYITREVIIPELKKAAYN